MDPLISLPSWYWDYRHTTMIIGILQSLHSQLDFKTMSQSEHATAKNMFPSALHVTPAVTIWTPCSWFLDFHTTCPCLEGLCMAPVTSPEVGIQTWGTTGVGSAIYIHPGTLNTSGKEINSKPGCFMPSERDVDCGGTPWSWFDLMSDEVWSIVVLWCSLALHCSLCPKWNAKGSFPLLSCVKVESTLSMVVPMQLYSPKVPGSSLPVWSMLTFLFSSSHPLSLFIALAAPLS